MTVVPRTMECYERVVQLGGVSFCRYATSTAWTRVSLFLTNTMVVHVLQGEKIIHQANGDVRLRPGQGFIARKGMHLFSEILPSDRPFVSLLWYINDTWLQGVLEEFGSLPSPALDSGTWTWTCNERAQSVLEGAVPYMYEDGAPKHILRGRFAEYLWQVSRQEDGALALGAIQKFGVLGPSVMDVLENNFTKPLQLKDFARLCGRSVASLVRDVRSQTGASPLEWIRTRRLSEARYLVRTSQRSLTEIAFDLGFSSPAQFSTLYRQAYGKSPREERTSLLT